MNDKPIDAQPKIMIVEDEVIIRTDLVSRVEHFGYQVCSVADSGFEAIEKAEFHKPDLVLMDIVLKGTMDGIEAAEQIRSRFEIPVVFITAHADEDRLRRAKLALPFGYILKPFHDREIKVTIEMALYTARVDFERRQAELELVRAEEALRENIESYRTLVENSGDIVIRFDKAYRVLYSSPSAGRYMHLTLGDQLGKNRSVSGVDEIDFSLIKQLIEGVFLDSEARETEFEVSLPHGFMILDLRVLPEFNAEGRAATVMLIGRDITKTRKVEQDYRTLFEKMLDGFAVHEIILNNEGRPTDYLFLAVNPAFENLTGLESDNIIGKTVKEVIPGIEDYWIETYGAVALTGTPVQFEQFSGDLNRYFKVTAFRPAKGQFACIFVDVTEQKKAENALKKSYEIMAVVMDSIEAQIFVANIESDEILFLNRHIKDTFPGAVEGAKCYEVFRGETERCHKCRHGEAPSDDRQPPGVTIWEEKNPITGRWRLNYQRPIKWIDDKYARLHVAYDLTDRKMEEDERRHLQAQLQQARKLEAIGTLAGGIAHDFNNLLGSIVGNAELALLDAPADTELELCLDEILKAAGRARDLIQQILAFSRRKEKDFEAINLTPIIIDTLKLLRATIPSTVEMNHSLPLPYCIIMGDSIEIQQVLINLCSNASHALAETGGEIWVMLDEVTAGSDSESLEKELSPGSYIRLRVSDNGVGIDPVIQDRIFDPYFTTKESGQGTGLGLATVQGIVSGHNGDIHVESEPGRGSTFTVYLPKLEEFDLEAPSDKKRAAKGAGRILFVDDEEALVDMGKRTLERLGYEVSAWNSSPDALAAFQAAPGEYDLVITDQTMPKLTGVELAGEILSIRPDIPIILCTGYSHMVNAEKARAAGIRVFISKPMLMHEIAEAIDRALAGGQSIH